MPNEHDTDTEREYAEGRNVSMYPSQWEIVERLADRLGGIGTSAALRYIVRDWEQSRPPADRPRQCSL